MKMSCEDATTEHRIVYYGDDNKPITEIIWNTGPYYIDKFLNYKIDYKKLDEMGFTDLAIKTMVNYKVTMAEACDLMRMFEGECDEDDHITLKMLLAKGINFKTHMRYFKEYGFSSDNYNMKMGDPVDA